MNYNEWLDAINTCKMTSRNRNILNKMKESLYNENINIQLEPKLLELIEFKITKCIKSLIKRVTYMYNDANSLDMMIHMLKKDILYIKELCYLKQISNENRNMLLDTLFESTNQVYDILESESIKNDQTGMYKLIINRSRVKRSELNELC